MHSYIKNCTQPTTPFTFCVSNEILDSNFPSEKVLSFYVLLGPRVRQFDVFWLSTEIVKLLCSPSVVPYTAEVW